MPFCRSLRWESMHSSAMPYLTQRRQGLASSHFLQAFWQFVQAFLTCRRLVRWGWGATMPGANGYMCMGMPE